MSNYFSEYDWPTMMSLNEMDEYDTKKYHQILSPEWPEFLNKYLELPLLQRLKGIGLLCGTDWTTLYKNRFYYSRYDHSVGVALIIWHFTRDKKQTIAGLLHDVSTPVFSHVSDFRKGDALTQTATEAPNEGLIRSDKGLLQLLKQDGLTVEQIEDYHKYPIADNEIPCLSADRLEYMFPSGMALDGSWNLPAIEKAYKDITILKNEEGADELGFCTLQIAEDYCRRFCMIGHILQLNENKLTLHLLGQIMNQAVELGIVEESAFMNCSEAEIIQQIEDFIQNQKDDRGQISVTNNAIADRGQSSVTKNFSRLYKTFRTMTKVEHTQTALNDNEYFCVSLKVKQRYINPLVKTDEGTTCRLSEVSPLANKIINDFLTYQDTPYGCVKLADC